MSERKWVIAGRFTDMDTCGPEIRGRYLELRGPGAIPYEYQTQYEFDGLWIAMEVDDYRNYRNERCKRKDAS